LCILTVVWVWRALFCFVLCGKGPRKDFQLKALKALQMRVNQKHLEAASLHDEVPIPVYDR